MNGYPLISVVILNWNRLEDTRRAIESVLKQTYPHFEVVVIDNHSEEPGSDGLPQIYPEIRFYRMDKNYGCPGGRNIGIERAKGEYVFFVDNDGILESHALENAYRVFQEHENVGVVAGRVIYYEQDFLPHPGYHEVSPGVRNNKNDHYSHGFTGCVTMHKRSVYDEIGMYNAGFVYGGEETNLALRLVTINQYVFFAGDVMLWHKKSDLARPKQFNFISA
ncbi:MAG: glycosyltransferase family 2 protein, partial [Dysgonamonadaceae bacterium]|nr:glycosyltransferase family 2 protein [Dysgonamonadaceae bacterium]